MAVKHNFISPKPPIADPTVVGSTEWNDDHNVTFGIGAGDIAEGNHLHTGVYEPVDPTIVRTGNVDWIDLTDGGATTLHMHAGGAQGPQGDQGPQGTQGTQGSTGAGTQGAQGNQGDIGSQGPQGTQGATGAGTQGSQGTQGAIGNQGMQGNTGAQGPQGVQGTQGTAGSQGTQGNVGANGAQGNQGNQGSQGTQGAQGTQGTQGPAVTSMSSDNVFMPVIGSPTIDTLTEDFTTRGSSGVIDGTPVYVEVDTGVRKVKVAAGEGYLRTSNDQQAALKLITWSAVTQIDIPAPAAGQETVRFIGIEYNGGSPQVTTRTTFNWNWYDDFPLARVSIDALGVMHILNAYAHSEDTANLTRKFLRMNFPFHREEPPEGSGGIIIGETGTRNLTLSEGYVWHGFNRYYVPARNTSGADRFDIIYRRAGGGFTGTASNSQWPNTEYDDGSGALATLGANKIGNLWIYLDLAEEAGGVPGFDMIMGRGEYTSITLAQAEPVPSIPNHLTYHGRLIARIIFRKSDPTALLIESAWTASVGANPVTDHAQLNNLNSTLYTHLTAAEYTDLTDAGFTSLHTHVVISATEPVTMTSNMIWVDNS